MGRRPKRKPKKCFRQRLARPARHRVKRARQHRHPSCLKWMSWSLAYALRVMQMRQTDGLLWRHLLQTQYIKLALGSALAAFLPRSRKASRPGMGGMFQIGLAPLIGL